MVCDSPACLRSSDRARLWLGQGSLGFRMVEPKSTANSANSREKIKKIELAQNIGGNCWVAAIPSSVLCLILLVAFATFQRATFVVG